MTTDDQDPHVMHVTVRGHTLYPVYYDDSQHCAHDGGQLSKRFTRARLASLALPDVYVDDRGWLVCFRTPRLAAILLVEAAVLIARHTLSTQQTYPPRSFQEAP